MERFLVVCFRTIAAVRGEFEERGGGIAFFPDGSGDTFNQVVVELVAAHFRYGLGPVIELGIATLDAELLERHCRVFGPCYWQGGEHD